MADLDDLEAEAALAESLAAQRLDGDADTAIDFFGDDAFSVSSVGDLGPVFTPNLAYMAICQLCPTFWRGGDGDEVSPAA